MAMLAVMPFPLRKAFETLIRVYRPEEVTSRAPEIDPRDVGVANGDVDAIWKAVVAAYNSGLYPAIALCIRRKGQVILVRAIGHAHGNAPFEPEDTTRVL